MDLLNVFHVIKNYIGKKWMQDILGQENIWQLAMMNRMFTANVGTVTDTIKEVYMNTQEL